MGVRNAAGPLPHGLGHGVLQRGRASGDGDDRSPQQAHPVDVQRLANRVFLAHEDHAFHVQQGRGGGSGHAVLPRAGLGNEAGLAHLLGQEGLTQDVVDLVGAGVVEVLALEVDLRAAQVLGHALGVVEAGGAAGVLVKKLRQLPVERRVFLVVVVGFFQLDHSVHQGLRDVLPPVDPKTPVGIGHASLSSPAAPRTARTKLLIFSGSFLPSVSMPELTSTA